MRLKNIPDPTHVEYAILEQNGMLSVLPKIEHQQATLEQLKITDAETGLTHIIISQGQWNKYNLSLLNKRKEDFEKFLRKKKAVQQDVFLLTIDDDDNMNLILKEKLK